MALDPITTGIVTYVGKEAIRKSFSTTWDFIHKKYSLNEFEKSKDKYIDFCEKILLVNTLASQEKSVFIGDIYVPLTLKGINTLSIRVDDSSLLDTECRAVLIKGYAGMGKSTILRKILANCALKKDRLPLFYELKNYKGGDIEEALSKSFRNAGISFCKRDICTILQDSNVKLFLDAYDEVHPMYREELLDEISRLINARNCSLIITSRPDTEIDAIADVETYSVAPLSQEQICKIIEKTASDNDKAKSLVEALSRSPLHHSEESILKSPILVVLFCISYNLGEEIPSTLSQFYANIFDTIFFRHDNLKGKVNRVRHWNDNRRIYRALFEYLCFISQRRTQHTFSRDSLVDFVADSLSYMNEDRALADRVTNELASITNLIIEDGFNEYRFIHKSIQEFFSAAFLCTLNADKKSSFYARARSDYEFYAVFSNTIFFLEEIDYYDYIEHYLVPAIEDVLEVETTTLTSPVVIPENLKNDFLDHVHVRVLRSETYDKRLKVSGVQREVFSPTLSLGLPIPEVKYKLMLLGYKLLCLENDSDSFVDLVAKIGISTESGYFSASLRQVVKGRDVSISRVEKALSQAFEMLYMGSYNKAVNDLVNRTSQINNQGYLDF